MCSVINKSAVPSWHPSKYTLLRISKAAPATVWQQEELLNNYKQMSLASLPATGVTAVSVCNVYNTRPSRISVSLPFSALVWPPWWKWEALSWKGTASSLPRLILMLKISAAFSREESRTCHTKPRKQLWAWMSLPFERPENFPSLPRNSHSPTVRENQARPFARLVQQGQDLPRDPSPLEHPCLLESLDPPAVKSTSHIDWISWIPMP